MGKRGRYEPGTFCWADLVTTDPAGAKAFYGGLFGWEADDMPAGDSATYTMLRLDGDYVGGLYEMEPERRELGIPPHWFSYVSVESADEVAARAGELGGATYGGPSTCWTRAGWRSSATPRVPCSPRGSRGSTRVPAGSTTWAA